MPLEAFCFLGTRFLSLLVSFTPVFLKPIGERSMISRDMAERLEPRREWNTKSGLIQSSFHFSLVSSRRMLSVRNSVELIWQFKFIYGSRIKKGGIRNEEEQEKISSLIVELLPLMFDVRLCYGYTVSSAS